MNACSICKMIVAIRYDKISYKHCIPPITNHKDDYDCSHDINHLILSLALNTWILSIYSHATSYWIASLRVSRENPTWQGNDSTD